MIDRLLTLQLGITDLCNFRCIMCPQTDYEGLYGAQNEKGELLHPDNRGIMELSIFEKILKECEEKNFNLNILSLIWLGESLLHPQFLEFYRKGMEFGEKTGLLNGIVFNTNGSLMDEELSMKLLNFYEKNSKKVYSTITFSIDSASSESFNILKPGASYEKVVNNIENFLKIYGKLYKKFNMPFVILLQMIVLNENFHEVELFKKRWSTFLEKLDIPYDVGYSAYGECEGNNPVRIVFKRASCKYQEPMDLLHKKALLKLGMIEKIEEKKIFDLSQQTREEMKIERHPCSAVFETAVVNWDGNVTPCCADSNMLLTIGNVNEENFVDILNGEKIKELRIAHLKGNLEEYRCFHCSNAVLPSMSNEKISEFEELFGIGKISN